MKVIIKKQWDTIWKKYRYYGYTKSFLFGLSYISGTGAESEEECIEQIKELKLRKPTYKKIDIK